MIEKWEAGISLLGTEVKSIRDGKMNIRDGFVKPKRMVDHVPYSVYILVNMQLLENSFNMRNVDPETCS